MLSCVILLSAKSSTSRTSQIQILHITCTSTQRKLLAQFLKYGKLSAGRSSSHPNWPPCIHVGYNNSLSRRLHSCLLGNMSSLMTGWFEAANWHQGAPWCWWLLYVIALHKFWRLNWIDHAQRGWKINPESKIVPAKLFSNNYHDILARIGSDITWEGAQHQHSLHFTLLLLKYHF